MPGRAEARGEAGLVGVSNEVTESLTDFVLHVFDHIRPNKNRVGNFLNKDAALQYIKKCKDK